MRYHNSSLVCFILGVVAVGALLNSGCSDNAAPPSSVLAPAPASAPIFIVDRSQVMAVPLGEANTSVSAYLKVTDGTELTIGKVKVGIESGTLPSSSTVTVTLGDAENLRFRVDPSSIALSKSIKLTVTNLDETDGAYLNSLRFFQAVTGGWSPISTVRSGSELYGYCRSFGEFVVGVQGVDGRLVEMVRWKSGPGYHTELIAAEAGGLAYYDRYKVFIPPGALSQDTYITVRDPGAGYVMCDLEPHGISFLIPVELEIDLSGTPYQPYNDWSVWWLSEETGLWEDQGGICESGKVRVNLGHFSRYAAGRAGW